MEHFIEIYPFVTEPKYTKAKPHTVRFILGKGLNSLDNYRAFFDCIEVDDVSPYDNHR